MDVCSVVLSVHCCWRRQYRRCALAGIPNEAFLILKCRHGCGNEKHCHKLRNGKGGTTQCRRVTSVGRALSNDSSSCLFVVVLDFFFYNFIFSPYLSRTHSFVFADDGGWEIVKYEWRMAPTMSQLRWRNQIYKKECIPRSLKCTASSKWDDARGRAERWRARVRGGQWRWKVMNCEKNDSFTNWGED